MAITAQNVMNVAQKLLNDTNPPNERYSAEDLLEWTSVGHLEALRLRPDFLLLVGGTFASFPSKLTVATTTLNVPDEYLEALAKRVVSLALSQDDPDEGNMRAAQNAELEFYRSLGVRPLL